MSAASTHHWNLERIVKHLLGVFLFLLPWQTIWIYEERFVGDSKWELATMGYYATELLLWFTVILFLVWFYKKKRKDIFGARINFAWTADRVYASACVIFILYAFLSSLWAVNPDITWQHALRIMLAFSLFFMIFIGPLETKKAMWAFIAGAAVQSVLGIWQFVTQSSFESSLLGLAAHVVWEPGTSIVASDTIGRWLRAYGSFQHPNIFGGYLVVSLLFTTWLSNHIHVFHSASLTRSITKLVGFALLFDFQILALFLTFSRGAWLAFVLFIVGLFFGSLYRKYTYLARLSVYVVAFIAILAIIFWPLVSTRLGGDSVSEVRSVEERLDGYSQAVAVMQAHPWVGVGVGGYTQYLHKQEPAIPGWQLQPVHSTPLLFVAEMGLVGFALFVAVVATFVRYQRASLKRDRRAVVRGPYALAYVFYSALFIFLILFDHYWFSTYIGLMLLMIYWALIFRSIREEDELLC